VRLGTDLDRLIEVSDALVPELVAPGSGESICPTCRSWLDREGEPRCTNCEEVAAVLQRPPLPIAVVSWYRKPSSLRDWLTQYKGTQDGSEPAVEAYGELVTALFGRMLFEHGDELARRAGGIDSIAVVPSTSRPAPHPLVRVLDALRLDVPLVDLLHRTAGDLGFRNPSKGAYLADSAVSAGRVLLVDDVYTTGARSNSAAFALQAAGHQVAGLLVLARRINPDYDERVAAMWALQAAKDFDWRTSPVLPTSGYDRPAVDHV
jgi:hypothetical protein